MKLSPSLVYIGRDYLISTTRMCIDTNVAVRDVFRSLFRLHGHRTLDQHDVFELLEQLMPVACGGGLEVPGSYASLDSQGRIQGFANEGAHTC